MHIGLNAKIGSWYKNIIFHLITLIGIWYTLLIRNISPTYQPMNLTIWLNARTALSNTSSVHQNTYQLCIPKQFAATQHQAFLTLMLPHCCTTTLLTHPWNAPPSHTAALCLLSFHGFIDKLSKAENK